MKTPATVIIMDGYGLAPHSNANAITTANTPVLDKLFKTCPNTALKASGLEVGLPEGQMGNSEVGHTNIGAGRIVYQELTKISLDIESGKFQANYEFQNAMDNSKNSALHLIGLVSNGGVHSHEKHLFALIELAKSKNIKNVYIHAFTDGRDVPPDSAVKSIEKLMEQCKKIGTGKIATIIGRFYAMDRDNRWERVQTAYDAMTEGIGVHNPDPIDAVKNSYSEQVFDEFIKPIICDREGLIKKHDCVIFFNFRPDRAREITRAFTDRGFTGFIRKSGFLDLNFVCMTQYDETLSNVKTAYPPQSADDTLGEAVSNLGLTQFRIAETEKYAHVTFFLNGGQENPFPGEERLLIPSPKQFPTYDLIPEMSAFEVAKQAAIAIKSGKFDIVIINFANCDMVGHTGIFNAAVRAAEVVDECVGIVADAVTQMGGFLIVTADHGNAEEMLAADGISPHTAHSINNVPLILAGADATLKPGKLCDIAPTLLDLMGFQKPEKMTGQSLIVPRF